MAKVKLLAHVFYRGRPRWLSKDKEEAMKDVRLLVFLNHTSLFEPVFIKFAPWHFVWDVAHKVVVPGADITMRRPLTGKLLKLLLPGAIPITRKKDESWEVFLEHVSEQVITAILPEGRMKRSNGLDKFGNPMTVRGGVADILERLNGGKLLFVYSGGLHHIQTPGENRFPRLFKRLKANLEILNIADYKASLARYHADFRTSVIEDMNRRLLEKVPS